MGEGNGEGVWEEGNRMCGLCIQLLVAMGMILQVSCGFSLSLRLVAALQML